MHISDKTGFRLVLNGYIYHIILIVFELDICICIYMYIRIANQNNDK